MMAGDFELAWRASDEIRVLGVDDPHRYWLGEDFTGKRVMLRCLHGFGDSLQFLRYLPLLNRKAGSVCVEVGPRFAELARLLIGAHHVIVWGEQEPRWDVQMEVMELPYIFRTQLADLPLATRYLQVRPLHNAVHGGLFRIGLMWTAGQWNAERAIAFGHLHPLLGVSGCEFWNLTASVAGDERLNEDDACRAQLMGLARRIATLDLVITVDTLAAHVAGALGVPAWVLLQQAADWRWMRERSDSPWYPSLRLFRQGADRAWEPVIAQATAVLLDLIAERSSK